MEMNEARAEQSSSTSSDNVANDLPAPDNEQNSSDEGCAEDN